MKIEIWTIGCSILLLLSSAEVSGQCLDPAGDVNGSGSTDVLDVQCIILTTLYVLSDEVDAPVCLVGPLETADVDCSGEVDVVDAILEVKLALLLPFDVVTVKGAGLSTESLAVPGLGSFDSPRNRENCPHWATKSPLPPG